MRSSDSRPSNGFCTILLLAVCLVPFCLALEHAQKPPEKETNRPKYDLHTETKMKATVEEVKLPPKGSEKEVVYLLVKSGTETVDVYLCPKSFLDDMGVTFSKGDQIAITGSQVKQGNGSVILAREIVKGADTLVFRDDKGKPVWS